MSLAALEVGPCVVCRKPARRAGGSGAQFRCAGSCSRAPTEGAAAELRYCDDRAAQSFVATFPNGAELEQIGEFLGVTRQRVQQIEVAALQKMVKRLDAMKISREDLALFISQRRQGGHPLEYTRQPKTPTNGATDAERHARRKVCACGATKSARKPACHGCMGTTRSRNADRGNVTHAIDRLPPSDSSVRLGAMAQEIGDRAARLTSLVAAAGPERMAVLADAMREWASTAEIEP